MQDDEKIVVVSYWTTTLDILAAWLKTKSQQYTRLDGSMNMKKRQKAIDIFNDRKSPYRTILLCAKAGGVGLNLTSGNRMILFDADWNPSWDLQVMGRIWREGQLKTVHIYRLFCNGTVEENVYQRQLNKCNLSDKIIDETEKASKFDTEELKNLLKPGDPNRLESFNDHKENSFNKCIRENIGGFIRDMESYVSYVSFKVHDEVSNGETVVNDLDDLDRGAKE